MVSLWYRHNDGGRELPGSRTAGNRKLGGGEGSSKLFQNLDDPGDEPTPRCQLRAVFCLQVKGSCRKLEQHLFTKTYTPKKMSRKAAELEYYVVITLDLLFFYPV